MKTTSHDLHAIAHRSMEVRQARPGLDARRDRYNRLVARVRILTLLLVLALIGSAGQTALIAWKWSSFEVRSFIFSADRLGEVRYLGNASEVASLDQRVIGGVLQDWIFRARTVTSDPAIQRQFVAEAQALTTGAARQVLQLELRRDRNPFEMARQRSVSVEMISVLPIGEGVGQWDLLWRERHTGTSGRLLSEERWKAIVTLDLRADTDRDDNDQAFGFAQLGWRIRTLHMQRVSEKG